MEEEEELHSQGSSAHWPPTHGSSHHHHIPTSHLGLSVPTRTLWSLKDRPSTRRGSTLIGFLCPLSEPGSPGLPAIL